MAHPRTKKHPCAPKNHQKHHIAPPFFKTPANPRLSAALCGAFWRFCHQKAPQPHQISPPFFTPKNPKNGGFPPSDISY
jgi:hypothetical protein